ncbi:MAG: hypothetical protein QW733_04125 [Desulfurococcaceae archaeon]
MITATGDSYRKPTATVLILGEVNERVVEKLRSLLRLHGAKGLRILVASSNVEKNIEALRDFFLSNITFTLEAYFVNPVDLEKVTSASSVVSVLVSNPDYTGHLPENLRSLVEVV